MDISLKFYVERARSTWEEGYAYFAVLLNDVAELKNLAPRLTAPPPPAEATGESVKRRFFNALVGLRPFAIDLPLDRELPLWSLGYMWGLGRPQALIRDSGLYATDDDIANAIANIAASQWNDIDWKECIIDGVEGLARVWHTFFDDVEAGHSADQIVLLGIQDRITFKEMVKLGGLDEDSTRNWSTKDRPSPAIPHRGRQAAVHRYSVFRPWFIKNRPDLAGYWPESYEEAMERLKAL